MVPSGAVTTMLIVLAPCCSAIAPDALPDVTATPFTVTVAFATVVVGVTVTLEVVFDTVAV